MKWRDRLAIALVGVLIYCLFPTKTWTLSWLASLSRRYSTFVSMPNDFNSEPKVNTAGPYWSSSLLASESVTAVPIPCSTLAPFSSVMVNRKSDRAESLYSHPAWRKTPSSARSRSIGSCCGATCNSYGILANVVRTSFNRSNWASVSTLGDLYCSNAARASLASLRASAKWDWAVAASVFAAAISRSNESASFRALLARVKAVVDDDVALLDFFSASLASSSALPAAIPAVFAVSRTDFNRLSRAFAVSPRRVSSASSIDCNSSEKIKTPPSPTNSPIKPPTTMRMNISFGHRIQRGKRCDLPWSSRYSPTAPNSKTSPDARSRISEMLRLRADSDLVSVIPGKNHEDRRYPISPYNLLGA